MSLVIRLTVLCSKQLKQRHSQSVQLSAAYPPGTFEYPNLTPAATLTTELWTVLKFLSSKAFAKWFVSALSAVIFFVDEGCGEGTNF